MTNANLAMSVLDASALLALVREERGAECVDVAIRRGVLISAANWAEVLSDLAEHGESVVASVPRVRTLVDDIGSLGIVPFDESQASEVARLRVPTKSLGLSLADRACLALGRLRRLPVLTTDRAWRSLHLGIKVEIIR